MANKRKSPEIGRAAIAVARAARYGQPEEADDARRELTAALLRRDIRAALAAAPALTDDQRRELGALLVPARKGS